MSAPEQEIKWFDLGRFSAALKVMPMSPMRGIAMTCLEVKDEPTFAKFVHGEISDNADEETLRNTRERSKGWWEGLKQLGFSTRADFYEQTDESRGRAFRIYSDRESFSLTEMQRIVPGITADDWKTMPLSAIVHHPEWSTEHVPAWKHFAEKVLANESIGVWTPKTNPFEKPFSEARPIDEVWAQAVSRAAGGNSGPGRSPLLGSDPAGRGWMGNNLTKANYRENALVPFWVDKESALADGVASNDLKQVDMPYAMPLWVERNGRVVALRDVRYMPEIMDLPPHTYVGSVTLEGQGLVTALLREAKHVEAVYREEMPAWKAWSESSDPLDKDAVEASIRRMAEAAALFGRKFPLASGSTEFLLDENISKTAPPAMKPMGDWGENEFRVLASRARAFVRDGSADNVLEIGVALSKRLHEQAIERAKDVAKEALRKVSERVQDQEDAEPKEKREKLRHEDTGEKIGGARKDFYRKAMIADDLEGMNEFEIKSLVVKKNVWPPLDYVAMKDSGVTPQAAMGIKCIKDIISTEPDYAYNRSLDQATVAARYVEVVGYVRDTLSAVKTLDDLKTACTELFEWSRTEAGEATKYIFGTTRQVQLGKDASNMLWNSNNGHLAAKITNAIRRKVGEDGYWGYLIKDKREKSEEEKEAEREKTETNRELHRPHLDVVERIGGHDWRAGRDIVAQDLIDHFGFRAVEFGEWLPQDERQTVLNMAFDSLCDLADALNLPPRGVSYDGHLALAFGARGSGGKNAALAHYEPGRDVANLTRMKGAGALAHEWFHGLDFHLGETKRYLSESAAPRFTNDPMTKLIETMKERPSSPDELRELSFKTATTGKQYAISWLYGQSPGAREEIAKVLEAQFDIVRMKLYNDAVERLQDLMAREKSGNPTKAVLSATYGATDIYRQHEFEAEIVASMKNECDNKKDWTKVKGKVEGNITWMIQHLGRMVTVDAAKDTGYVLPESFLGDRNSTKTGYMTQAEALDKTRSSPYWATNVEMFARAGAQYVLYKLADAGVRSDYLVYGADEERYMQHPVGNPNPVGADRLALQPYFAAVIEEYRLKLTRKMEATADTPEP